MYLLQRRQGQSVGVHCLILHTTYFLFCIDDYLTPKSFGLYFLIIL